MMKDEMGNKPESYFKEQWNAADSSLDPAVSARMKGVIDRAIKPAEKHRKPLYRLTAFLCAAACLAAFAVLLTVGRGPSESARRDLASRSASAAMNAGTSE